VEMRKEAIMVSQSGEVNQVPTKKKKFSCWSCTLFDWRCKLYFTQVHRLRTKAVKQCQPEAVYSHRRILLPGDKQAA